MRFIAGTGDLRPRLLRLAARVEKCSGHCGTCCCGIEPIRLERTARRFGRFIWPEPQWPHYPEGQRGNFAAATHADPVTKKRALNAVDQYEEQIRSVLAV